MDKQNSISNGQQQITGAPLDAPADCTIACDEGHLTAHKLILCDHSKYLQDILSKFPTAEHPIIILTELNIMDIRILVNYMYTGELVITSDSSPTSLLRAAQILKIDSLTDDDQDGPNGGHQQQDGSDELDEQLEEEEEDEGQLVDFEIDEDNDDHHHNNHNHNHHHQHLRNRNRHHHPHNHHHLRRNQLDEDDEEGLDEEEDEDDDHNNNNTNSNNTRLINSIRNIYNLQFIDQSPQQIPLSLSGIGSGGGGGVGGGIGSGGGGGGENTTTSSKSDFGSNSITSNHHLDLEDLQDSRPVGLDNKNNKIRCHLCNIGLSDVKCLYRHVLTRHLPEKWGYKCEFCDREFSRDDHLMRHYTTKHKNMEFNREKIRETRRLNREMAKNFHDQISTA